MCSILSCRPATYDACIKRGNISYIEGKGEDGYRKARFIIAFITGSVVHSRNIRELWYAFIPRLLLLLPLLTGFVIHYSVATQDFFIFYSRSPRTSSRAPILRFSIYVRLAHSYHIRYVVPWMCIACCTSTKASLILISYLSLSFALSLSHIHTRSFFPLFVLVSFAARASDDAHPPE